MSLKELQGKIFEIIRHQSKDDSEFVVNDKKIGSKTRLNTYINSSYLKAKECIEDDFEASLNFIENKDQLIKDYLTKYPPDTHFINECGRHFLKYLYEISYQSKHDFLFDLIKLEWLRVESFYDFYNYKIPKNQDSEILVNPSLKVVESHWPLDIIWSEKIPHAAKQSHVFIWTTEDRIVDCQSWDLETTIVLLELLDVQSLEQSVENLLKKLNAKVISKILEDKLSIWINKGILHINPLLF